MNSSLVLAYNLNRIGVQSLHFYGYLDLVDGQIVCCVTKKTVGELILDLQKDHKEYFVSASVMPEKTYFETENNYLVPTEISLSEYEEMFNILPPARNFGGFNFEMFMLPEVVGGKLYSHFLVTFEPYTKKRLKAYKILAYRTDPFHRIFNACPL